MMTTDAWDTHAHLYLCKKPISEMLAFADSQGVKRILVPGTNLKTSIDAGELSLQYPNIVIPSIGIHPSEEPINLDQFENILAQYPFKAIGEIGLDYFYKDYSKSDQQALFQYQLGIAKKYGLPILIHNRDADDDISELLMPYQAQIKVFHCYSTGLDFARKWVQTPSYFSFSGNITYSKKESVWEVIAFLPLTQILIETDCPYLAPIPYRGKENEPGYIIETARKIADIKQISLETVLQTTTQNANRIFGLT